MKGFAIYFQIIIKFFKLRHILQIRSIANDISWSFNFIIVEYLINFHSVFEKVRELFTMHNQSWTSIVIMIVSRLAIANSKDRPKMNRTRPWMSHCFSKSLITNGFRNFSYWIAFSNGNPKSEILKLVQGFLRGSSQTISGPPVLRTEIFKIQLLRVMHRDLSIFWSSSWLDSLLSMDAWPETMKYL